MRIIFFKPFEGGISVRETSGRERGRDVVKGGRKDKLGGRGRGTEKVFPEWCWG